MMALVFTISYSSAWADTLGVRGGVGFWGVDFSGNAISNVSLHNDLNIKTEDNGFAYVALEHPIPLLPNVKVAYTRVSDSATNTLTKDFVFNGIPFLANQTVNTKFDLTHVDFTFYYEMLDVGYDLDLGITGRYFIGELTVSGVKEDLKVLVPLIYVNAKFGLPVSGFYADVEINASSYIKDFQLRIGWETEITPGEFGIAIGYRKFHMSADKDDIDVDMDIDADGFFISLTSHF